MNLKASNFFVFWLIILFCVNNLEFSICHKCHFDKIASSYFCEIIPSSSSSEKKHHDEKTELTSICERFKNLIRIDVYELKSVDENLFQQCRNFYKVWIQNSEIEEIKENLFLKHSRLTYINLSSNKLRTLPEDVFINQKELDFLDLSQNQISCLPSNVFKSLTRLQYLKLEGNKIESLNPKWFENLQSLPYLHLSYNKIQNLPKNVFARLENLENLYLNRNQLTTIHRKLEYISLKNNKINAIDEKLIDNTAVSELFMNGNVCRNQTIEKRDKIKQQLSTCFKNYQPRQESSKQNYK